MKVLNECLAEVGLPSVEVDVPDDVDWGVYDSRGVIASPERR